MKPRKDHFRPLFLDAIGTGHGVHPQPSLQHQTLAHLQLVLNLLRQAAPAHHLELAGGIIRSEPVDAHGQFRHRSLIVLGEIGRAHV